MNEENPYRKNELLYWFLAALGVALIFASFLLPGSIWGDLLLNVGATLIATTVLAFLFQRFGGHNLTQQITEIRSSLTLAQRALTLGIEDIWQVRRDIPNTYWNLFTASGQSEVWLFGVAELGFADDEDFHRIVSKGTTKGCNYRFLLLDPDSDAAAKLDSIQGGGQQVQGRIRRAIGQFQAMRAKNAGKTGKIEIRVYVDDPHISIVGSDNALLATYYTPPLVGNSCFSLQVRNVQEGIFDQYEQHFETTWKNAKPI